MKEIIINVIVVVAAMLLILLTGDTATNRTCAAEPNTAEVAYISDSFGDYKLTKTLTATVLTPTHLPNEGTVIEYMIDPFTGVVYIIARNGDSMTITPRLNDDGSVMVVDSTAFDDHGP